MKNQKKLSCRPVGGVIVLSMTLAVLVSSCGGSRRYLRTISSKDVRPLLSLSSEMPSAVSAPADTAAPAKSELLVFDEESGRTEIIMEAVASDDGQMVAHENLSAAVVTARFRNVAERGGKVTLLFDIAVPEDLRRSIWQLRFYPKVIAGDDTLHLESVLVTGKDYRSAQSRGYEHYMRLLESISRDSQRLVDVHQLDVFISRNIPSLARFREDSTFVSDREFSSAYGVSEKEAIEHYTSSLRRSLIGIKSRIARRQLQKVSTDSLARVDTLLSENGDCIYTYRETIGVRAGLRKVLVEVDGAIFVENRKIYDLGGSEALTFYISSLSSLARPTVMYRKEIIERVQQSRESVVLSFKSGSSQLDTSLSDNGAQVHRIEDRIGEFLSSETFVLDSIVVTATASPEGSQRANMNLSRDRSAAVTRHFRSWLSDHMPESEIVVGEDGQATVQESPEIEFKSYWAGESWFDFALAVDADSLLTAEQKARFHAIFQSEPDLDSRERTLMKEKFYPYLRQSVYPLLRKVDFDFHSHRRGMVRDTIETMIPDSTYLAGVEALRDFDYDTAADILSPYSDYNAALAALSVGKNASALRILEDLSDEDAGVEYLKAIALSRLGQGQKAATTYLDACKKDPSLVHRGNLDPEINTLIDTYKLSDLLWE